MRGHINSHCGIRSTSQVQNAGDKDLEDIATLTEEVDLRLGELKKCTFDFKRDVLSADPGGIADKEQGGGSGGGIGGGCGGGSSEVDADKVMRCVTQCWRSQIIN